MVLLSVVVVENGNGNNVVRMIVMVMVRVYYVVMAMVMVHEVVMA